MYADTHAHVRRDLDTVIQKANENEVEIILTAGTDLQSSIEAIKTANNYDSVYACVGIHPWNVDKFNLGSLEKLRKLTYEEKVVAISEIGLDFVGRMDLITMIRSEPLSKEVQIDAFQKQVRLAKEVKLPIILHCNAAHSEVLNILKQENASEVGGVVHGFNGNITSAEEFINIGFYISIGRRGITTPDNTSLQEVVKKVPIEKLLIETDSGEPVNVKDVAEKIGELKGISMEEVGLVTTSTLRRLLRIS